MNKVWVVDSDDSIMVWLNGKPVWKNNVNRGSGNFPENFKVSLKKRNNPLLVKVGVCLSDLTNILQQSVKFNTRQARGNLAVNLEDKSLTAWGEIKAR